MSTPLKLDRSEYRLYLNMPSLVERHTFIHSTFSCIHSTNQRKNTSCSVLLEVLAGACIPERDNHIRGPHSLEYHPPFWVAGKFSRGAGGMFGADLRPQALRLLASL